MCFLSIFNRIGEKPYGPSPVRKNSLKTAQMEKIQKFSKTPKSSKLLEKKYDQIRHVERSESRFWQKNHFFRPQFRISIFLLPTKIVESVVL